MKMDYISISQVKDYEGKEVSIRGWVYRERGSSKYKFITIRDSTNIIQCVVDKNTIGEKKFSEADHIHVEASLSVTGIVAEDKRAPTGYELHVTGFEVIGKSPDFPITKDQSPEFLLDNRHLWLRSRKMTAVMKVRATVICAFREYFENSGFIEFTPPIFTPNACEGGSTLFEVKYFNEKLYLTQSWQLYAEAAIYALERIYTISPCFRSEKSKTSRHLSEFWMAEMEAAWLDLDGLAEHAKKLVAYIIEKVIEKNQVELKILDQDIDKLKKLNLPFKTITYTEALDILKKDGMAVEWGKDLRTVEEDKLMEHFDKPIVVTNYPKEVMAFYKPKDPLDPKTALCMDMLAPGGYGEIIGGSQRSTDLQELQEALKEEGENLQNYEWYLDLRRYGNVPHAGFGLGIERVVAWLCGLDNIKDAIGFPRTMLRYRP
jgi:asparaginyl-tRNA synthetase